jgi:hypothetical protein
MNQPSHYELGQQIARLAAIIEPLPERLDRMQDKWDADIKELRGEVAELNKQRSHLLGIGVGIGITLTFFAGLITAIATGFVGWFKPA